ncbi:tyrosine-type recombinase/integrase [Pseudalkalibacillus decolorationis]|uniref:tyrosine-type recombinase/integrase n=1 Tax=Pseudalkalibacillus decolorationis TaxID=163879 RepID=UPI0021473F9B|nr:tyrosine-type recombinase/integrase [Pseudalkalibacillus decolorationis]
METKDKPRLAFDFIYFLEKKGKRPSTIKRYRYDLEDFLAWIRVNELSYEDDTVFRYTFIQSYFDFLSYERNYSFRTLKRVYSVLNQYHGYLKNHRVISENPLVQITIDAFNKDSFSEDMFITENEQNQLIETIQSEKDLTENQLKAHSYLTNRNVAIIHLMLKYGLTLQDIVSINMRNVSFIQKKIIVRSSDGDLNRSITLTEDVLSELLSYYSLIPQAVRPTQDDTDPFFVAFDFQRLTYRWSYEEDQPKRLTNIAIQKMIRQEVSRAGLRKGISSQHFRRTAVLNAVQSGKDSETIQYQFGMKTPLTLNRYYDYVHQLSLETT